MAVQVGYAARLHCSIDGGAVVVGEGMMNPFVLGASRTVAQLGD
ncbi:hypothetical protein HBNXHr_1348 [Halorhabdus sp. BNX81]|nr:hypothetical protein HBNXHr_1348 [Halorhabdus sp. BNX81]